MDRKSFDIQLVYPEQRQSKAERGKFAVIDENTRFRISTDFSEDLETGDPKHATHAIGEFSIDGNVIASGLAELIRLPEDPGTVILNSRKMSIENVPERTLMDFDIRLGHDINSTEIFEFIDIIYYTGSVNNVAIVGDNIVIAEDGVLDEDDFLPENQSQTLFVPLAASNDGSNFTVQFFGDFSGLPFVVGSDCVIIDPEVEPIVSINSTVDENIGIASNRPIFISDDIFDFQSFFFEVPAIPRSGAPYDVFIESGAAPSDAVPGVNLLMAGMILEEEMVTGNALLFDFDTSFSRVMAQTHEEELAMRATGNIGAVYKEMEKVFDRLEPLIYPTDVSAVQTFHPGDIAMLEVAFTVAKLMLEGSKLTMQRPNKFYLNLFTLLSGKSGGDGINHFAFSGNRQIPLILEDPARDLRILIPMEIADNVLVDMSGNLISFENQNLTSANTDLQDLYKTNIVDYYFVEENIWAYLESITDLEDIEPIPEEEDEL